MAKKGNKKQQGVTAQSEYGGSTIVDHFAQTYFGLFLREDSFDSGV